MVLPVDFWTGALSYNDETIEFGQVDSNGISWVWQGFDREVDVDGGVDRKVGTDGTNALPQFLTSANITLRVSALAPTWALRDEAKYKLNRLVPVNNLAYLRVDEPVQKYTYVRRAGVIKEEMWDRTHISFNIGLVAPDPRMYGTFINTVSLISNDLTGGVGITPSLTPPLSFPDRYTFTDATVNNAGNYKTDIIVTMYGPRSNPGIVNMTTGQTVKFTGLTLDTTDTLVVNFNDKVSLLNGSYISADITSSWWQCEPGNTTLRMSGSAISAPAVVAWQNAYL